MQEGEARSIVQLWETVAVRGGESSRNLFAAMRDDVCQILRDLVGDGVEAMPTGPLTLVMLAGETILDLTISDEANGRIEVEMWPPRSPAIEAKIVEDEVGGRRIRTWTFRQGQKRPITIAHQRAARAHLDEEARQGFAFKLAKRAGWPIPDKPTGAQ
jgi:hypothetical protein